MDHLCERIAHLKNFLGGRFVLAVRDKILPIFNKFNTKGKKKVLIIKFLFERFFFLQNCPYVTKVFFSVPKLSV